MDKATLLALLAALPTIIASLAALVVAFKTGQKLDATKSAVKDVVNLAAQTAQTVLAVHEKLAPGEAAPSAPPPQPAVVAPPPTVEDSSFDTALDRLDSAIKIERVRRAALKKL